MTLEDLEQRIDGYAARKAAEAIRRREAERKKKEQQGAWTRSEDALLPEKQEFYDGIVGWAESFSKTPQFKRLFSHDDYDYVIFWHHWGHEQGGEGSACWSRLCLDKKGKLRYWAGYKQFPFGPSFYLSEETFPQLSHAYLQKAHAHVTSGKVYGTIAKEVEDRMKWL